MARALLIFLLIGAVTLAAAEDIRLQPAPGSRVIITDANGNAVRLEVTDSGLIRIPGLAAAPTVDEAPICFDQATGTLGNCPPGTLEGPPGPEGPQGIKGEQGVAGEVGPAGPIGPAGEVGEQGSPGEDGATGPAGDVGPQGVPGETGATGPAGETGATGPTGAQGIQGPQGESGLDDLQYQRVETFFPSASGTLFRTASCPAGKRVVGGGFLEISGIPLLVAGNGPSSTAGEQSWVTNVTRDGGGEFNLAVYAICITDGALD